MRIILQRVTQASVKVNNKISGNINTGLLLLLGIEKDDTEVDIKWISNKCVNMRIFNDAEGKMNKSLLDIGGELLVVSQFTLYASTKKGNRPSFINAAPPEFAKTMYQQFCRYIENTHKIQVQKGVFGADMKVSLLNEGPVTILLDSKRKE